MNTRIVKKVAVYLIGAAIGGGIGWLIGDYLEAHIDDNNEPIYIPQGPAGGEPMGSGTGPVNYESESEIPPELTSEKPIVLDEKRPRKGKDLESTEKKDYTKFAPSKDDKAPIEEVAKKYLGTPSATEISEVSSSLTDAHVIDFETYAEGRSQNRCVTWSYYSEDDTMADENEEIVPNPENFLGDDFRNRFGEESGDKDTVYIRSNQSATDYEIVRLRKKYSVVIAGEAEVEVKKAPAKKAAVKKAAKKDEEEEEEEVSIRRRISPRKESKLNGEPED